MATPYECSQNLIDEVKKAVKGKDECIQRAFATILAGIIAALLRKFMFDDKKPSWIYGSVIAMITEVLHMLMISWRVSSVL